MGIVDVVRNPRDPKRAKEYLFIASVTFIASVYGVFRDYITFSISREYFVIAQDLGTEISFNPDIVVHAIRSTYWVGILIGVVFSFTNNPNQNIIS